MATSPRTHRAAPARAVAGVALCLALLGALLVLAAPALAQPAVDTVVDEVADTGSYVEVPLDDDLRSAIDEANSDNIAVVLLEGQVDAVPVAREVTAGLRSRGAPYRTVLVVSSSSAGGASDVVGDIPAILSQGSPTFDALAQGRTADGIRSFTAAVTGSEAPPPQADGDGAGGGGGFPWTGLVVVIALLGVGAGGWWLLRERRSRRQAEAELAARRDELGEQVRNNADKVIGLGDRVLAHGDPELVDLYASASETYRDVSQRLDSAHTLDTVSQLDRRMDEAEWQLEVIEARLAGRTPPPPPAAGGDGGSRAVRAGAGSGGPPPPPPASPPPPGPGAASPGHRPDGPADEEGPVLGRDESLFGTVLPPAPPSRLPGAGRRRRRRLGGRW